MSLVDSIKKQYSDIRELPLGHKLTIIAISIALVSLLFGSGLFYKISGSQQQTQTIIVAPTYSDSNIDYSKVYAYDSNGTMYRYTSPTYTPQSPIPTKTTQTPIPEQKLSMGQTATFKDHQITVYSFEKTESYTYKFYLDIAKDDMIVHENASKGKIFYIFDAELKNTQNSVDESSYLSMTTMTFDIRDSEGNRYSASNYASNAASSFNYGGQVAYAGQSKRGKFIVQVPITAKNLVLNYKDIYGGNCRASWTIPNNPLTF